MWWLDWAIYASYLGVLAGVGIYFSRRQSNLEDFVRGGQRFGGVALGFSLMAALNSATDYIQTPAIVFAFGTVYLALILTWIPLYFWVTRVTLPFYQALDVYSAYEYLERRFGLAVRLIAASTFVMWRIGWMAVALYVPCLAVKGSSGGEANVEVMIVGLGAVVTGYTMFGGIKAVIWTDLIQFVVMFVGLFATLAFAISSVPGGVPEIAQLALESGRLNISTRIPGWEDADFVTKTHLYFTTEITFVGILACILVGRFAVFTSDQVAIQRFQSSRNPKEARSAFVSNAFSDAVWMLALGCVGLTLFAYYQHFSYPSELRNDQVLPYFMSQTFPAGLKGLVNAAIIAASLSSVGAALNSATAVIVIDFYNRLWLGFVRPPTNLPANAQRRQIIVSRCVNAGLGVVMVAIALNIERMGEIYTVANKILGAFFGILLGSFLLGMFSRRATSVVTLVAAVAGLFVSCFLSFFSVLPFLHKPVRDLCGSWFFEFCNHISWQWPPVLGIAVTLLTGFALAMIVRREASDSPPLTFAEVVRPQQSLETLRR